MWVYTRVLCVLLQGLRGSFPWTCCKESLLFLAQNKRSFRGRRAVMYRIHLVLHISTFSSFLFPRLNRGMCGNMSRLVYLCPEEVIMGSWMHRKWEILSSCERSKASECVELKKGTEEWRLIVRNLFGEFLFLFLFTEKCKPPHNPAQLKIYLCCQFFGRVYCVYCIMYKVEEPAEAAGEKGACCSACPAATVTEAQTRSIEMD